MTEQFDEFQGEIDAALADPVRRARVERFGREIDLILALSAIREEVGMTQEAFAAAALMSQENVSRIERATDVKLSTIRRIAKTAGAQLELNAVMPSGKRVPLLRPARNAMSTVREPVEAFAPDDEAVRMARAEWVLTAGTFDSGLADVSERHDDYLAEGPRGW